MKKNADTFSKLLVTTKYTNIYLLRILEGDKKSEKKWNSSQRIHKFGEKY